MQWDVVRTCGKRWGYDQCGPGASSMAGSWMDPTIKNRLFRISWTRPYQILDVLIGWLPRKKCHTSLELLWLAGWAALVIIDKKCESSQQTFENFQKEDLFKNFTNSKTLKLILSAIKTSWNTEVQRSKEPRLTAHRWLCSALAYTFIDVRRR